MELYYGRYVNKDRINGVLYLLWLLTFKEEDKNRKNGVAAVNFIVKEIVNLNVLFVKDIFIIRIDSKSRKKGEFTKPV